MGSAPILTNVSRLKLILVALAVLAIALGALALIPRHPGDNRHDSPQPVPGPGATYPGEVLDLLNWKLTLPVDGTDKKHWADEVRQPCLAQACKHHAHPFSDEFFHVNQTHDGVVFRAPVAGSTTSGSDNVRTELRELGPADADGKEVEARWSNKGPAVHTMELDEAITATPRRDPSVVCAQIHNDDDDVILIKLRGHRLFANADRGHFDETLDDDYQLGKRFTLRLDASDGAIRVTYNGTKTVTYKKASDTMYFKAGVYNQSNLIKDANEDPTSYGEVVIYSLKVDHHGAPVAKHHD